MGRAPCCDKANVKRGPWSPEEDNTLRTYLETHGTGGNWIALPAKAGLRRCGKSCRLRWLNYLRPDIKHGGFTEEEDNIIISLYNNIGSRWSVIASHLPGRTDNDVKNYWNTKLKKKLSGKINLKKGSNSNGNATSTKIFHLSPVQLPGSMVKVEDSNNYGISANLGANSSLVSYQMGVSYQQEFYSQGLFYDPITQIPLPKLMEVSEFNTSGNTSYSISSSQEASSLSAASSSLALDNSRASWPNNNGGRDQDDEFLMELGFGSPYELLNGFGFQEQVSEPGLNQI